MKKQHQKSWTASLRGAFGFRKTTGRRAAPALLALSACALLVGANALEAQSAVRTLPASYQAGQSFTVTIDANPGEGAVYAVEDYLPAGWTATAINEGGTFDSTQNAVKWVWFDVNPRNLSYEAVPPGDASGTAEFSGVISVDGSDTPITGDSSVSSGEPQPGPSITQHPQDQTVDEGGTANFSVTAEGTGTVTYQWLHDGSELAGETGSTLTIENVSADHVGVYRVEVTDDEGTTLSNTATLQLTGTDGDGGTGDGTGGFIISSEAENLPRIHNLAGSYDHNVNILNGTARLQYTLTWNRGRLTGDGTIQFNSDLDGRSFSAPLAVRAQAGVAGPLTRMRIETHSQDIVQVDGANQPFRFRSEHLIELSQGNTNRVRTNAIAQLPNDQHMIQNRADNIDVSSGSGHWTLDIDAGEAGSAGSAVLTLDDGTTLPFAVRTRTVQAGTLYNIRGTGNARGNSFDVLGSPNQIQRIRGNVLRQRFDTGR